MRLLRREKPASRGTDRAITIYYASDIHGSDLLWRKFLRAAAFYGGDALIMGGDLVGKAIVPIAQLPDGSFSAEFLGAHRAGDTQEALDELIGDIRFNGYYPWVASPDEVARQRSDDAARAALFDEVVRSDLRRWMAIADSRKANGAFRTYVMAGNDDPMFVDTILQQSVSVIFCDDQILPLGRHELLSLSYSNITPWNSPRELDEDALYKRIAALASQLERPREAIFNLHVPPYNSGLDTATQLDAEFRPVYSGGTPKEIPVGSTAVRQILEEYQPLVSLHGHIHESRGRATIGKTLALNPGSEYVTGRIHGALVSLGPDSVLTDQFVMG